MRYRNTRTQAVIETACVVSGGDWVVEEKTAAQLKRKTAGKKGGEKNDVCHTGGYDNIMAGNDAK